MFGFEQITDLAQAAQRLQRRSHGVIETADGTLTRVVLRPFPKTMSMAEAYCCGRLLHRLRRGDRCRLYFNEPRRCRGYLTLQYVLSNRDTSFATFRRALVALDQIAAIKNCQGIVADVSNWRISDRLLARWGWQPHLAGRWHRHFIKRFAAHRGNVRQRESANAGDRTLPGLYLVGGDARGAGDDERRLAIDLGCGNSA